MGSVRSYIDMFDSTILRTGWVEGSERSRSKFDQNRVGGRYQAIMEQVEQQKTRYWVAGGKQEIGGASDWGVIVW